MGTMIGGLAMDDWERCLNSIQDGSWKAGNDPELYCAAFQGKPCDVIDIANELAGRLQATADRLPEALDWEEGTPMPVILADIRHRLTNYEEIIVELPQCGQPVVISAEVEDCDNRTQAHDIIKWAANGIAQQLYERGNQ